MLRSDGDSDHRGKGRAAARWCSMSCAADRAMAGRTRSSWNRVVDQLCFGGRHHQLELPCIPTEIGQQPMLGQRLGPVVDAPQTGRGITAGQVGLQLGPQGRRRVRQPEVDVAVCG